MLEHGDMWILETHWQPESSRLNEEILSPKVKWRMSEENL